MSDTCLYCAWWCCQLDVSHLSYGECRRYPPTRPVTDKDVKEISIPSSERKIHVMERSGWSIQTRSDDFCGEFKLCPEEAAIRKTADFREVTE